MPPAAPMVCPMAPLMAVMDTCGARSPSSDRMAASSSMSPAGVLVACAATKSISDASMPDFCERPPGGPQRARATRRG